MRASDNENQEVVLVISPVQDSKRAVSSSPLNPFLPVSCDSGLLLFVIKAARMTSSSGARCHDSHEGSSATAVRIAGDRRGLRDRLST